MEMPGTTRYLRIHFDSSTFGFNQDIKNVSNIKRKGIFVYFLPSWITHLYSHYKLDRDEDHYPSYIKTLSKSISDNS